MWIILRLYKMRARNYVKAFFRLGKNLIVFAKEEEEEVRRFSLEFSSFLEFTISIFCFHFLDFYVILFLDCSIPLTIPALRP